MPPTKAQLRSTLKAALAALSPQGRAHASEQLCDQIIKSDLYQSAAAILCYAALPSEISLDPFINRALRDGKVVCVPRVDWEQSTMECVRIFNLDNNLQIGRYGLRSPSNDCQTVPEHEITLALIPGLGFDAQGSRLGRGGGFYDRWIESRRRSTDRDCEPVMVVGVGFDEQIVRKVPTDAHDQWMDRIVTPTTQYERSHG